MAEFIVHDLIEHGRLKSWIVLNEEDVINNYSIVFGKESIRILGLMAGSATENFQEIKRYYQFVGIIKYHYLTRGLTMNLFETDDMDTFLDAFKQLESHNWRAEHLKKIGSLMQEIIDDKKKELATIRLKKPF